MFPLPRRRCNNGGPWIALAEETFKTQVGNGMWMEKLMAGVVRVVTPIGPRFIELSFWQRAYFLWIFRNFDTLPQQVLSERERRVIDQLCVEKRFVSLSNLSDAPVIGTLERIPAAHVESALSERVAEAGAIPLVADGNRRS